MTTNTRLSIPPGTLDVFGASMRRRQHVLEVISKVYESFGFEPLHTPVLEHADVFKGHHGEGEQLLFRLTDKHGTPLVLRYDLTVPLARVVSMYPQISIPYKRYQLATSYRDDKPDKGHFREFIQCDGDMVGISDLSADADIIALAHTGLSQLGFSNFTIRINHRKIIKGLAEFACGKDFDHVLVQRALDNADKVIKQGMGGIKADLIARGLCEDAAERFVSVLSVTGKPDDALQAIGAMLNDFPEALQGVSELRGIISHLPESIMEKVSVDLTLARGADYYTGFILEGVIPGIPIGAVLGGGRYDNLIAASGGKHQPAVGMAFGLERILAAMHELGLDTTNETDVILVHPASQTATKNAFGVSMCLRSGGLNVDFLPSVTDKMEAIAYAVARGFRGIVTCHDDSKVVLHEFHLTFLTKVQRVLQIS